MYLLQRLFGSHNSSESASIEASSNAHGRIGESWGFHVLAEGRDTEDRKPLFDIIAIHGLNGHYETTWTADNGVKWLEELLPKAFPHARIMSYGYDSRTHSSHGPVSLQTLPGHSQELLQGLSDLRAEEGTIRRPILFIAHSLGGIVLKGALVNANMSDKKQDESKKGIKLSTFGIIFLGTPHEGSSNSVIEIAQHVLQIARVYYSTTNQVIKELGAHSQWLEGDAIRFNSIRESFMIRNCFESYPTPLRAGGSVIVVPKWSAAPQAWDAVTVEIMRNHVTMTKFRSANDQQYEKIVRSINLTARGAEERVKQNWDEWEASRPGQRERKDKLPSDPIPEEPLENTLHAFTLRKKIYENADENDSEIEIISQDLWNLLKELLSHHPYHIFQGPRTALYSPYEAFILNWEDLEKASKATGKDEKEKQARLDLKLLLDTIASGSGDLKLDKYFKTRESNKDSKSVTFETLWTLFPPGALIYGKPFQGQDQVLIVQDNIKPWPYARRGTNSWALLCWTYDWDGKKFRRMSLKLEFEQFDGHKPITSLPYYPLELNDHHETIKANLVHRGRDYRKFCTAKQGSRMFNYSGKAIFGTKGFAGVYGDDDKAEDTVSRSNFDPRIVLLERSRGWSPSDPNTTKLTSVQVESAVMVDFESYFRYGPAFAQVGSLTPNNDHAECACSECRENEGLRARYRTRFDEETSQIDKWEEEQFMLCSARVLGYILRDKQWAQLQVTLLQEIQKDPSNPWASRLKLADGEETKNMILDLVNGHGTNGPTREEDGLEVDDIVARKGKGLVILLYGPPGVGKTSTAETVAVAARKPLFSISVADVGTRAKNVETNLSKIFALATSWQAILLIDEADVFLESRGKGLASNTERNALVSVFLRMLEYYQGILMLTTNQIAQFDVAVQSRVHVAIKYDSLNKDQTMAIFEGFLGLLAQRGHVKDIEDITEWLKEDVHKMRFDGRQIRNIVTSAIGLARAAGNTKLEKKHIKKILSNVNDFNYESIRQFEKYRNDQQGMVG